MRRFNFPPRVVAPEDPRMVVKVGNIEVHLGPKPLGTDDLEAAIVGFIQGAKETLDVAVQELDNRRIAQALIDAMGRGVRLRIVLESDYLGVDSPVADPWTAVANGGRNENNRAIHAALLRAGAAVHNDFNPDIFHQKFILRDAKLPDAALLTGSTNFTDTDCSVNLNHVVILRSAKVASEYAIEFEEIQSGTFGPLRERRRGAPRLSKVSGVCVKAVFAPDQSPEMEIMKQMLKAKSRIDFAMFTFAQSSGIDDTMAALSRAKVKVRGVLDRGQGNQAWSARDTLQGADVDLRIIKAGNGVRKLHHKLMVIDDHTVIVGSFNYTGPANALNDENIIVLGELDATSAAELQAQKKLADAVRAEIDHIVANYT